MEVYFLFTPGFNKCYRILLPSSRCKSILLQGIMIIGELDNVAPKLIQINANSFADTAYFDLHERITEIAIDATGQHIAAFSPGDGTRSGFIISSYLDSSLNTGMIAIEFDLSSDASHLIDSLE